MQKIRTRFAPSPTGYLHIGGLRTALYSYLFAKKHGGVFVLRIEDTDTKRYVLGAEEAIMRAFARAGLQYDEGPDLGGPFQPYIQTQRLPLYRKYAEELIYKSGAYVCFCTPERLEVLRKQAEQRHVPFHYDGHCKKLTEMERIEKLQNNLPRVIRQNIPVEGTTSFDDAVFGRITVQNRDLDEGVLIKSDGIPTYNFANVIDDHLMEITHVMRGSEFLPSTPKFILLYQAFGWTPPVFVHLPVIVKEGGKKLSKREKDAAFEDLLDQGFLPEAIINYVALLGWNPKTEQEIFTLKELEQQFDLSGLNKAPAVFDRTKLFWVNSQHIQCMPLDVFHAHLEPYYINLFKGKALDLKKITKLLHTRTKLFSEVPEQIQFFVALPEYDTELFVNKKMKTDKILALEVLQQIFETLEKLTHWDEVTLRNSALKLVETMKLKNGQVLWPFRVAISGKQFTPGGAIEIAYILGKQESLDRITKAVEKLR